MAGAAGREGRRDDADRGSAGVKPPRGGGPKHAPNGEPRARRAASEQRRAQRAVLWFLLRFLAGWAIALTVAAKVPAVEKWAIRSTVFSIRLLTGTLQSGLGSWDAVTIGRSSVGISPDCTPLLPSLALWVAILACPAPGRWKLLGILGGSAALWAYNIVRIVTTALVLDWRPQWFEFVHVYLWQTVTVAMVIGLFLIWTQLEPRFRRVG